MFKKKKPKQDTSKRARSLQERYPQYQIGRGTYGGLEVLSWGEGATLRIGAFCSIASDVKVILGGEHRIDWVTTYPFNVLWEAGNQIQGHPKTKGDVTIGNDVWIGTEAIIMSGVIIGDGAVIGARALVTKNMPPYAIVVGNPALVIKKRFDKETIQHLLEVKWWEWEDARIEKALHWLLNNDIKGFLEAVEKNKI